MVARMIGDIRLALGLFGARGWLLAAGASLATMVTIGIPAAIVDTPLFIRMTPVRAQDYAIWILTGLLMGLIAGTFAGAAGTGPGADGKALSGGLLSLLAVGCPICNKLVVLLLGESGALSFFAPAQLYLGVLSLVLLSWASLVRVRALAQACPVSAPR